MPDFTRESRLAVEEPAVQDHPHSESPADIDKEEVLVLLRGSGQEFSVGHCSRVVLDENRDVEGLFKDAADGHPSGKLVGIALAGLGIDSSGNADAKPEGFLKVESMFVEIGPNGDADSLDRLFFALEDKRDIIGK